MCPDMLPSEPAFATVGCREIDLLCESARILLHRGEGLDFRMLLDQKSSQSFGWSAFERTADRHAMMSLVVGAVTRAGGNLVPPDIGKRFHKRLRLTAYKNLMYVAEWRRLLSAFHAAGISVISMKGPSLAMHAYADLALRDFTDLDLLVRRDDVIMARDVLTAAGYKICSPADSSDAALLRSGNRQLDFANGDRGALVDLHWEVLHEMFSFQLPTEELFKSARPEQLEGISFLSLSPEYLLLYLCAHGTKHCWIRLRWLCDVAFHVHSARDLDWKLCLSLAESTNCDLVLKHSLLLTEQMLGLDLPPLVKNYCNDTKARKLADFARTLLLRERDSLGRVEELRYYLAFAKGWRDYARLLFERLFVPTETEWGHVRLPRMLYCLYYVIRPARFVWVSLLKAAVQSRGDMPD